MLATLPPLHRDITASDLRLTPEMLVWFSAAGIGIKASYRVDEVARLICVGERAVYRMIARGDLDALRVNATGQRTTPTRIPISSLLSLWD